MLAIVEQEVKNNTGTVIIRIQLLTIDTKQLLVVVQIFRIIYNDTRNKNEKNLRVRLGPQSALVPYTPYNVNIIL
jgi:hypothetical protein